MSNDWTCQCNELTVCNIIILPSRESVGLSVETIPTSGSWNPRITNLALGFRPVGDVKSSFQVKTHFEDMIRLGWIRLLSKGSTVCVSIQQFNSFLLAWSNCFFSASVRFLYWTSVWVFFTALFNASAWKLGHLQNFSNLFIGTMTSNLHTWACASSVDSLLQRVPLSSMIASPELTPSTINALYTVESPTDSSVGSTPSGFSVGV